MMYGEALLACWLIELVEVSLCVYVAATQLLSWYLVCLKQYRSRPVVHGW